MSNCDEEDYFIKFWDTIVTALPAEKILVEPLNTIEITYDELIGYDDNLRINLVIMLAGWGMPINQISEIDFCELMAEISENVSFQDNLIPLLFILFKSGYNISDAVSLSLENNNRKFFEYVLPEGSDQSTVKDFNMMIEEMHVRYKLKKIIGDSDRGGFIIQNNDCSVP